MNSDSEKTLILNATQVDQKIRRIAFEIHEHNFKEKTILLAGIDGQGYSFAKILASELESISPFKVIVGKVSLDKLAPQQGEVKLDLEDKILKNKCVILVDDVLNTGRTLAYSLRPFLNAQVKKIEVAVLVNRSNTKFPIIPIYTGYGIATMLNDHVEVVLGKKSAVYLH